MEDLYAEIREQHKRDYGSKFEEWAPRILVDQYSDRTHFIFELIQNAEDAGATYVTFTLYPDRLVSLSLRLIFVVSVASGQQRMSLNLEKSDVLELVLNLFMLTPRRLKFVRECMLLRSAT